MSPYRDGKRISQEEWAAESVRPRFRENAEGQTYIVNIDEVEAFHERQKRRDGLPIEENEQVVARLPSGARNAAARRAAIASLLEVSPDDPVLDDIAPSSEVEYTPAGRAIARHEPAEDPLLGFSGVGILTGGNDPVFEAHRRPSPTNPWEGKYEPSPWDSIEAISTVREPARATEQPEAPTRGVGVSPEPVNGPSGVISPAEQQAATFSRRKGLPKHKKTRRSQVYTGRHERYVRQKAEEWGVTAQAADQRIGHRGDPAKCPIQNPVLAAS
jgi:hypothetical protein